MIGEIFTVNTLAGRLAALVLIIATPLALTACNAVPTKEEAAKARWADVQSQYQRRADLIPNLVATVKGYAAQEERVLTEVTEARASATRVNVDASTLTDEAAFARYAAAQDRLSGVLGRLMMVTENYPELRSNANFLALQSQLEGTENRINVARMDYNRAVQDYNTTLRTFPGAIEAKIFYSSSRPMQLFTASAAAQNAPVVNFDQPSAAPGGGPPAPGAAPGSAPPEPAK